MDLCDVGELLNPRPLNLETGFERLDDGVLHVAVRTDMHGCIGEMFEWWFRSRPDTSGISGGTRGTTSQARGTVISPTTPTSGLSISPSKKSPVYRRRLSSFSSADPKSSSTLSSYALAVEQKTVSTSFVGRVGLGHPPPRSPAGDVLGARLLHIGRDTSWGLVMRSHFFLGEDLPGLGMAADDVASAVPDEVGPAMLQHAYNEFTFLSRFPPSLFIGANRDRLEVDLPW